MGRFSLLNLRTLKVRGQELGRSAEREHFVKRLANTRRLVRPTSAIHVRIIRQSLPL